MRIKNNKGGTLVVVLLIILILVILGIALMSLGFGETKQVIFQEKRMQAYYLGRAGAMGVASWIESSPNNDADSLFGKSLVGPVNLSGGSGEISDITVEPHPSEADKIIVSAVGSVPAFGGTINKEVSVEMVESFSVFEYAIFSYGSPLNIGNNTTIIGDVGTNGHQLDLGNSGTLINGAFFHGTTSEGETFENTGDGLVTEGIHELDYDHDYFGIDLGLFPEEYDPFESITTTWEFDTAGGSHYKRVRNIDMSGSDVISLTGDGELHLLVEGNIIMSGTNEIQTVGNTTIYIYCLGDTVKTNGSNEVRALFYAPYASFEWVGGGSKTINGSVIAGSYLGAASNTVLEYDNNLDLSHLAVENLLSHKISRWID